MNLEALGRTYHGGAPAPLQPGDLVTSRDAPDGAPDWVGEVTAKVGSVWCRRLGEPLSRPHSLHKIRPLSDAEAVGLAEMLAGREWDGTYGGYNWRSLSSQNIVAYVDYMRGTWEVSHANKTPWVPIVRGNCYNGCMVASASRALIAYTIRG